MALIMRSVGRHYLALTCLNTTSTARRLSVPSIRSYGIGTDTELTDTERYRFPKLPLVKTLSGACGIEALIPGYVYDDLDRHGNVWIWKVAKMAESVQLLHYRHNAEDTNANASNFNFLSSEYVPYLLSARHEVTSELYSKAHLNNILFFTDCIESFDMTSYIHVTEGFAHASGELLQRSVAHFGLMDAWNKPVTSLPSSLNRLFGGVTASYQYQLPKAPLRKPEHVEVLSQKVHREDANLRRQTNHACYMRLAHDGMMRACFTGGLTRMKDDIGLYRPKVGTIVKGLTNTSPGDWLTVNTWEDPSDPTTLHSTVEHDDRLIFQCSLTYGGDSHAPLL